MSNRRIYPGRQWKDRLAMWAEEFPRHYMVPAEELKITGFFTKERLSMSQALERAGQEAKPVPAGTAWGNYWEYGWFFAEMMVPESLAGKRLVFVPGFGEEMLVWVNGKESGAVDKIEKFGRSFSSGRGMVSSSSNSRIQLSRMRSIAGPESTP